MNAQSKLTADSAVISTRYWQAFDCFSVVLSDGRLGIAPTVGEALDKANEADAENVRRAA